MSQFGKEPDPSKGGAGGAQKDCDACGNRDHVQQARKGDNWDKTRTSAQSGAAQTSADRAGDDKHGGIVGPVFGGRISDWGGFRMDNTQGGFRMAEIAEVA